ncbi:hypothetical protein ABB29_00985 [Pseudoxanthomonas dokdonensis]|uniref:Uncharacterized protein n=1 Tax=Pseudoxanthomonas dokdonensis TaxID=344882 RepID=A0A0R0D3B2_9GAMM|nr:hypothetical protein ABB29_00985 [Pseudoxanthomonas dokdonensis]
MSGHASETSTPSVVNHQANGNLESKHPLGCIGLGEVKNDYTPADLYKGVAACVNNGDMDKAAGLFSIAGAYGIFDTLRVTDRTAHQAVTVLKLENLGSLPKEEIESFQAAMTSISEDSARMQVLCQQIRQIGAPSYVPRYMIQHGMSAFTSKGGDELDPSFDKTVAWDKTLESYLHCPSTSDPEQQ